MELRVASLPRKPVEPLEFGQKLVGTGVALMWDKGLFENGTVQLYNGITASPKN